MKTVTPEDLLKLEMKFGESQKEDRHSLKGEIQKHVFELDEYKIDQALIKQTQTSMKENINEIKNDIKEGFKSISNSFDNLPKTFATKDEHKANQKSIDWIIKILWTFGIAIILGLGGFVWTLITDLLKNG